MIYTLDEIKKDLRELTSKQFYIKHIIRSDNWYLQNYLGKNPDEVIRLLDDYRLIISENMGVSMNSIMMVGSGKIGYSLSPPDSIHPENTKLFEPFNDDEMVRKVSDLDIAIISNDIFQKYWGLFRKSFKMKYITTYSHVYQELYRGYINERNIMEVDGCRVEWNKTASISKKRIHDELYFIHDISFRIYRSWEDFEDYNIQNIEKLKKRIES